MIRCKDCKHLVFNKYNSKPSRYYCNNSAIVAARGARMVSRCDRHDDTLKIKTSPKWCPRRGVKDD